MLNFVKTFFMSTQELTLYEIERQKDVLATKKDIHELDLKIEHVRAELIKWMFIFWIGQLAAIFTMIKVFFS